MSLNDETLLKDIREGLDRSALLSKYGISEKELDRRIATLAESSTLTQDDLTRMFSVSQMVRSLTRECPFCGATMPLAYDTCTRCGQSQ